MMRVSVLGSLGDEPVTSGDLCFSSLDGQQVIYVRPVTPDATAGQASEGTVAVIHPCDGLVIVPSYRAGVFVRQD